MGEKQETDKDIKRDREVDLLTTMWRCDLSGHGGTIPLRADRTGMQ
jgi:hypothetical protein